LEGPKYIGEEENGSDSCEIEASFANESDKGEGGEATFMSSEMGKNNRCPHCLMPTTDMFQLYKRDPKPTLSIMGEVKMKEIGVLMVR